MMCLIQTSVNSRSPFKSQQEERGMQAKSRSSRANGDCLKQKVATKIVDRRLVRTYGKCVVNEDLPQENFMETSHGLNGAKMIY